MSRVQAFFFLLLFSVFSYQCLLLLHNTLEKVGFTESIQQLLKKMNSFGLSGDFG